MTTEKWQLYSQTGVDGPEYGVRIRTGYTVVGFQKEDAQAIVAWQNASIQPEGDIMEKAKALRNAALPRQTYSIPGQTGYGNPSLSKGWDFSAVDELVRVVVLELIAEVERLRSLNESLMENGNDLRTRCQKAEARIKELEEANRNIDKRRDEMAAFIERLEAAFLKAETLARSYTKVYPDAKLGGTVWYWAKTDAREELERIKEGRKDE